MTKKHSHNTNSRVILGRISSLGIFLRRHTWLIVLLVIAGAYGFMVYKINIYDSAVPSQNALAQQTVKARAPLIDQQAVKKIQQLQSSNIKVKVLFEQARNNPFP